MEFKAEEAGEYLDHYGVLRRSGRYPWGTTGWGDGGSDTPEARARGFLDWLGVLRDQGMTEVEIAKSIGMTTSQLRTTKSVAVAEKRAADIAMVESLKAAGNSNTAIAKRMGIGESQVRALLEPGLKDRTQQLTAITNMLRDQVDSKGMLDVGKGVAEHIGVSPTKMKVALAILDDEGYGLHTVKIQTGPAQYTDAKVLTKPGISQKEAWLNRANIHSITEVSEDGGRTFLGMDHEPLSISSKRVQVRYAEEGGADADGIIYVRPGVKDLSMNGASYAQVRIAVDGTHYLKGMAVVKDDLPDGVDLQFNTAKSDTGNKLDAMKKLYSENKDQPFGATIKRQLVSVDKNGNEKVTSVMNIVNEPGDWDNWSKTLSSQFLSKQDPKLTKQQLDLAYERRLNELDVIMKLNNPSVRQKLLETFSDDVDSAAVKLKAAALPGQQNSVILPSDKIKQTEIYAPRFQNGDRVALVRHPHAGPFEIPELIVNNRGREFKALIGDAVDAVIIHPKVAERMSGADFDGDTVLVLNNNQGRVKSSPALEGLKDFDPKAEYPKYEGMKVMTESYKENAMGQISNLITDMSIKGAKPDELARAVRHSMVVIDAVKHELNYKLSAERNGIAALKKKYQEGGASTIISRASSEMRVPQRRPRKASLGGPIDPETGRRVYTETGRVRKDTGKLITTSTTRLAEATDAYELSSGTKIENIYAEYSNRLKALANKARKESISVETEKYSPSAKKAYQKEVDSLDAKLKEALKNAPRERKARLIAEYHVSQVRKQNPGMTKEDVRRLKRQALATARARTAGPDGPGKTQVVITEREYEAIQAGAVSKSKLDQILNNADIDQVKKLAMPREQKLMTSTKIKQAKAMADRGYTLDEIAKHLGVSRTTLTDSLQGA